MKWPACMLLMCAWGTHAAEPSTTQPRSEPLTLAGQWSGTWTDSREEYSHSGASFSCVAVDATDAKEKSCWQCVFRISKTRTFEVKLQGRAEDGKIVFTGAVDLGSVHGVYTWKGVLTRESFSGEYDGPGEKGTFKMARAEKSLEK